ncbi:MAG: enolase C-terminal domain-like protein [Caldilineaceae bacterium]
MRFLGRVRHGLAVRSRSSPDFSNLLDWRRATMAIERYKDLVDFMLVESPAPRNDIDGLAEFRRRCHRPVSEHVLHIHHGWQLLSNGCVDIFNISPYLLGGSTSQFAAGCTGRGEHGSASPLGQHRSSILGTAAVAHLAAAARILDYPGDNTGPQLYTDDVVKTALRYEQSHLLVPEGPGLGLEIDEAKLQAMTANAEWTSWCRIWRGWSTARRPIGHRRKDNVYRCL